MKGRTNQYFGLSECQHVVSCGNFHLQLGGFCSKSLLNKQSYCSNSPFLQEDKNLNFYKQKGLIKISKIRGNLHGPFFIFQEKKVTRSRAMNPMPICLFVNFFVWIFNKNQNMSRALPFVEVAVAMVVTIHLYIPLRNTSFLSVPLILNKPFQMFQTLYDLSRLVE